MSDKADPIVGAILTPVPQYVRESSHSGTVEDERLREIIAGLEGYGPDDKRVWYSPDLIRSAFTELLSLRSRAVEAGELVPVAWLVERFTEEGKPFSSSLRFKEEPCTATVTATPLYPASSLTSLQARVEELERERDKWRAMFDECAIARDAAGFLGTVPQCIAHLDAHAEALSTRLQEAEKALEGILACTHQPNPTDPTRIDIAPGKHRKFEDAIHRARSTLKGEA